MEIIEKLKAVKVRALHYFDLPDSKLHLTYADGKWNIRQLLVHIADAESVLYDRIRRIISEQPRPVLWAFDQDNWAAHLDYNHFPLAISKELFSACRDGIIHFAKLYYVSHGDLSFIHSGTGLRTLKDEIDKVANHAEHHLDQIALALERSE